MKLIVTIAAMSLLAASLAVPNNAEAQYTNNRPLVYGNGATQPRSYNPSRSDAYDSSPASEALRQQYQSQQLDMSNQRVREQVQDMLRNMQGR